MDKVSYDFSESLAGKVVRQAFVTEDDRNFRLVFDDFTVQVNAQRDGRLLLWLELPPKNDAINAPPLQNSILGRQTL